MRLTTLGFVVLAVLVIVTVPGRVVRGEEDVDLSEAEPLLEAADEMYEEAQKHEQAGDTKALEAACVAAFRRYETCLAKLDELLGDRDHEWKVRCWTGLGECAHREWPTLRGPPGALKYFERSLAMRQRLYPENSVEVADGLYGVGDCHYARGYSYRGIPFYKKALAILEVLHPGDHPDKAGLLGSMGMLLDSAGQPREAVPYTRRAWEMQQRLQPDDEVRLAWTLNTYVWTLACAGYEAEALERIEELRALWARIRPGDHVDLSTGLDNLAYALRRIGHLGEAIEVYYESLEMRERLFGHDAPGVVPSLVNLSFCYETFGRYDEVLALRERVYDISARHFPDRRHPDEATLVGWAWAVLGEHEEAVPWFEQAIRDIEDNIREDRTDRSNYRNAFPREAMARSLGALGRWEDAAPHAYAAHAINEEAFPEGGVYAVRSHGVVGRCCEHLDRMDEAQTHYEAGLAMARAQDPGFVHAAAARLGWFLLEQRGDANAALPLFEEAVELVELLRQRAANLMQGDVASYFENLKAAGSYEGLFRARLETGDLDGALETLDRGRARGLLDLLSRSRIDPLDIVIQRAEEAGEKETEERARKLKETLDAATRDARFRFGRMNALRREPDVVLAEVRAAKRAWQAAAQRQKDLMRERALLVGRHLPLAAHMDAAALRGVLGPREALVCYSVTERSGRVLFVPPEGGALRAFTLRSADGKAAGVGAIAPLVDEFLDALVAEGTKGERGEHVAELGHTLHQTLVPDDLWKAIEKLDRVLLVPHGVLHRIPFEALVVEPEETADARRYWLDDGPPIAYAAAGAVFAWSQARRRALATAGSKTPIELVALGDPVFTRDGGQSAESTSRAVLDREAVLQRFGGMLIPLPGTRREVLAIQAIAERIAGDAQQRVVTLLGEKATKAEFGAWAGRARFLHVATHHLVDEANGGAWSRLALTVPTVVTTEDDGFLTLMDLLENWRDRLHHCELVVLSGCETNRGPEQKDEGVLALPWGFYHAGAPAVVASLWRVADESTATLMTKFYGGLAAGKDHVEALQEARKTVRAAQPEPYYWAPFVYLGAPGGASQSD